MTDNTTINRGTDGDVIATDDIAGVKHQKVKMEFGKSDTATQVSSADPLPVLVASENLYLLQGVLDSSLTEILEELKKISFHLNIMSEGEQ